MADSHRAGHIVQNVLIEHSADQTDILVAVDHAVFVDSDAGSLLTAVLECEQRGISVVRGGDLLALRRCDAEYAALLVNLVKRGAVFS